MYQFLETDQSYCCVVFYAEMSEIRGQDDIDGDAVSQEDDMSRSFLAPNFTVEEIEENGEREFCHSYRHKYIGTITI